MALLADRVGARVPGVLVAAQTPDSSGVLVTERITGRALADLPAEKIDDDLLERIWAQVARLHRHRIAHRDLRPANIVVDHAGEPWLVDFGFAAGAASSTQLAGDVAELLAATAARVGVRRAAAAAHRDRGDERLVQAVPLLQPVALSSATRAEARARPGLLEQLRDGVAASTGRPPPPAAPLTRERVTPSAAVTLVVAALAVHLVLPQVGDLTATLDALWAPRWSWVAAGLAASAASYVAAAVAVSGATSRPLAFGRTVALQVASTFPARLAAPAVGRVQLNERCLQRAGATRDEATAAVGRDTAAGFAIQVLAILAAVAVAAPAAGVPAGLPRGWPLLVAVAASAALFGWLVRGPVSRTVLQPAVQAARDLRALLRQPRRALGLLGGSAGVTVAYIAALGASLAAFGVEARPAEVAVVYLLSSAAGTAARTPGGLGVIEAALVAGLLVVAVAAGPAVAAVLCFRALTFWLPLPVAAVVYHLLRRRDVL